MELRDLREECRQLGFRRWRRASELRLQRFRRQGLPKKKPEVHSLDLETLEPLLPSQRRFVWPTPGHRFVFEPLQLMRHFMTSGGFLHPLTRAPISNRQLRRLCRRCEVGEELVDHRDEITARAQRGHLLQSVARMSWDEMLAQPNTERLALWYEDMARLREHDVGGFQALLKDCFGSDPRPELWF
jgi:hypothetical protein